LGDSNSRTISPSGVHPGSRAIHITDRALARINIAFAQENLARNEVGLRLDLSGGGCAGLTYELRLEKGPQHRDRIFHFDDLRLFVTPKSFIYLAGSVLDWDDSRGFSVADPNWPNPCGCGSSFTMRSAFRSEKPS
jgi:iron-sulfur cluster assembly protein